MNAILSSGIGALPPWVVPAILIGVSVLMLTVIFERGYILFRLNQNMSPVEVREIVKLVKQGKYDDAKQFSDGKGHPGYRALKYVLENRNSGIDLHSVIEEAMVREQTQLERFTSFLGTTSTLAPMLGLLGTVTGMIKAFSAFARAAQRSSQLVVGIDEALITTTLGLIIAIPALIFFNLYVKRTSLLMDECQLLMTQVERELR